MNLLTDPIFRVKTASGCALMTLPGLLEALGEDQVFGMPGLQRHQEDAFHIFLCYLAGAILIRTGRSEPIQDESYWRKGLRALASGQDEAWCLIVEDPTKPAFMQPPTTSMKAFQNYKMKAITPDSLDVLQTAKNHDVKSNRIISPSAEYWIYTLISLQTMAGFFGQGNYGIARMNGGFGSRPYIALRYSTGWGDNFRDEVQRLLILYKSIVNGAWGYTKEGLALTWLLPWDGKSSLTLDKLHPFFIEVSRAIRLIQKDARIVALATPTKAPRIAAKDSKGMLGDPWIPINSNKQSALTLSASGFTPGLIRSLIFEDGYELQAMQRPLPGRENKACNFYASVLVRGQGTTDGFRERTVPIPGKIVRSLFHPGAGRNHLNELSKEGIGDAGTMQNNVLRPALYSLLEGGPEKLNFDKREVSSWMETAIHRFADDWAAEFFPWLWRTLDMTKESARLEWRRCLRTSGLSILREAIERSPARSGRRFRSRVHAEGFFFGSMFRAFPDLKEERNVQSDKG